MDSKKEVILVGGFHDIIELCEMCGKQIIGIIDNQLENQYMGYKILGNDNFAKEIYKQNDDIPIVITPDIPKVRIRLSEYYLEIGFKFCNLIHPNATVSKYAKIGKGVVIQNGVNISANVTVEDFVKINTFANIMHDSLIGKYTTVAPNAVILGKVKISETCYIGSNCTILPYSEIGANAIVGAGAVVTRDVKEGATVIGVPAREIQKDKNYA